MIAARLFRCIAALTKRPATAHPKTKWITGEGFKYSAVVLLLLFNTAFASPPLQHADIYAGKITVNDYLVSEKLDGVRAYWNGSTLLSKQGNLIHAPDWFIQSLPADTPLDGELWIARSQFSQVLSTVSKNIPIDREWQKINYMLFDLPASELPFLQRYNTLTTLTQTTSATWLKTIPQQRYLSEDALMKALMNVVDHGGEGLMLHHQDALYRSGRQAHLLKLKHYLDAEAEVLRILPGKGRLTGMMGSLEVQNSSGRVFKVGSGFSDAQRKDPPRPGSLITYRYTGYTSTGLPRFAVFLRQRDKRY